MSNLIRITNKERNLTLIFDHDHFSAEKAKEIFLEETGYESDFGFQVFKFDALKASELINFALTGEP